MPFVFLQPGEQPERVEYLSDIDHAVQITSGHIHVYVDAHARTDDDDVRQIRVGNWIALKQSDLPDEIDPQCQQWDFAHVMYVRQHVNLSGFPENNTATLTLQWLRGYHVPVCDFLGVENRIENCRHYCQQNFQVMTSEHGGCGKHTLI